MKSFSGNYIRIKLVISKMQKWVYFEKVSYRNYIKLRMEKGYILMLLYGEGK